MIQEEGKGQLKLSIMAKWATGLSYANRTGFVTKLCKVKLCAVSL